MFTTIVKLFLLGLIPVVFTVGLKVLDKYTKFKNIPKWPKQILVGLILGAASVMGSEFGVKTDFGVINVRDSAPICAGLVYGLPAGIIAGFIGGFERFMSVYWGAESLYVTRYACSISTFCAGIFAGLVRITIFDNKHGKWYYGFICGVFVEVFHMLMVFVTKLRYIEQAYNIVIKCSVPMIVVNSLCVTISMLATSLIYKEKLFERAKPPKIRIKVQSNLAISILVGLSIVVGMTYAVFKNFSKTSAQSLISTNIEDVIKTVNNESDEVLLTLCKSVETRLNGLNDKQIYNKIMDIVEAGECSEINIVGMDEIIYITTNQDYMYYDMRSGAQSREFGVLNSGAFEYVQPYGKKSYDDSYMKYAGVIFNNPEYGYIQVGIDETFFKKYVDEAVKGITNNRHIGEEGSIIITNANGTVLSSPHEVVGDIVYLKEIKEEELVKVKGGTSSFDQGNDIYYYATVVEGYYIIGLIGVDEADLNGNISSLLTLYMLIFVFFIMYIIIYEILKGVLINKLANVNVSLKKIASGDLNEVCNERSSLELNNLSNDINSTVDTLKDYIKKEGQKIEAELQFAKNIQHSSLPNTFPPFPQISQFDIYATMDTAKEVGGDFYDFYLIDSDHLAFLIADVSGKGVPAAMFMMQSKTIIKSLMESGLDVGPAITLANKKLCEGNDAQMFVTAWIGVLDINTGVIRYVNAGHNPPIIGHADGTFEYLKDRANLVLAAMDIIRYPTSEMKINEGDQIFLYTDGVTEATNINKELYGEPRLLDVIKNANGLEVTELCKSIKEDVDKFVGEAEQADDITMLSLQYHGKRNIRRISVEAKIPNVAKVIELADEFLQENDCPMKINMQIDVAIDEIVSNIVYYAYPEGVAGVVHVIAEISKDKDWLTMTFEDQGVPYNPLEKDDPDITLSADERNIGGLGIYMVKNSMDDMIYNRVNGRNMLTIKKKLI